MAAPNEVRFNVRHNVLLLKTFGVPQLKAITGLNRQSIHTEVRRMEKEGLVSRVGTEKVPKGSTGGRPRVIYQLTEDPEKRFELLQSVRAFYTALEETSSELPRPESKHYFIAKRILEDSLQKAPSVTQDEDAARLLDMIQRRLEYARMEEEVGEEGTQLIAASLDILEAKAIDALAGDWEGAVGLLDQARGVCEQLEAADLVGEIRAYVQTVIGRMVDAQIECDDSQEYARVEEIASYLGIVNHRFGDWPEVSTSVRQAEQLAKKARLQQISTQVEETAATQTRLFVLALDKRLITGIAQMPGAAEEPKYQFEAVFGYQPLAVETETTFTLVELQLPQEERAPLSRIQWTRRAAGMSTEQVQ